MNSVLFVCTANICRSPIAEGLMRDKVKESINEWRIESAGTWAFNGDTAALNSQLVLAEMGIDISKHRSQRVNNDLLHNFNLILTMEQGHKEAIQVEFPKVADRVYLLSEMVGKEFNIHDPIGSPLADFRVTAKELNQLIELGYERIEEMSGKTGEIVNE